VWAVLVIPGDHVGPFWGPDAVETPDFTVLRGPGRARGSVPDSAELGLEVAPPERRAQETQTRS